MRQTAVRPAWTTVVAVLGALLIACAPSAQVTSAERSTPATPRTFLEPSTAPVCEAEELFAGAAVGYEVSQLWRETDRYGPDLIAAIRGTPADGGVLRVPSILEAEIRADSALPNRDLGFVFELMNLVGGSTVVVEMFDCRRSWEMDTYLYLYDATAGQIIADDDDSPDTHRSELVFVVEPGVRYVVIASSWSGVDTGPVLFNVTTR